MRWLSPLAFIAASRSALAVVPGEPGQQLGQALHPRDECRAHV
ncbi:hypothetical protein [Arthrobacter sp. Soil736]|nr:hypothetical protein [Arthrobacter sp. Soil736]